MKMHNVYHLYLEKYLRESQYFPAMRLHGRLWLPKQIDGHNCGIGVLAAVATILCDVVGKNNEHHERYCESFARYNLFIDETEGEATDDKPEFFIESPKKLHNNTLTGPSKKIKLPRKPA